MMVGCHGELAYGSETTVVALLPSFTFAMPLWTLGDDRIFGVLTGLFLLYCHPKPHPAFTRFWQRFLERQLQQLRSLAGMVWRPMLLKSGCSHWMCSLSYDQCISARDPHLMTQKSLVELEAKIRKQRIITLAGVKHGTDPNFGTSPSLRLIYFQGFLGVRAAYVQRESYLGLKLEATECTWVYLRHLSKARSIVKVTYI
jgi:hypothetical protein